jgi:hypothetical protein
MKKIKLFLEFVNGNTKSFYLPQMTLGELAKKFNKTIDYISEFETYLQDMVDLKSQSISIMKNSGDTPEEIYKFNLEENFPSSFDDEVGDSGL